ncbi:MAG: NUDIX domain-containing protein [Kiloniellales bacterium]|nr:NUDIX domain-containing protein [Kiloniellales bacterium]
MQRPRVVSRPRDAASLVLLRRTEAGPEVLLGRRPASSRFMPEVYVFPGGALEPEDRQDSGLPESFATLPQGTDAATASLHPALVRCALRELHEETGLLLTDGTLPGPVSASSAVWSRYRSAARRPAFRGLSLVFRAVTPPGPPLRFDTRFFRADGVAVEGRLRGSGELEDLAWRPLAALDGLPLRRVTHAALAAALAGAGGPGTATGEA